MSLLRRYAGSLTEETGLYARSSTFFLAEPGQPVDYDDDLRARAHFLFFSNVGANVTLIEGGPAATSPPTTATSGRPSIEVWMGATAARQLGVGPGDTFDLHPFWRDDVEPVEVTVAGLVEPLDPEADYWFGNAHRLVVDTTRWPTYPFIIDERTFVEVIAPYLPSIDGTFETYAFVDTGRVNSRNAEQVELNLRALERQIRAQLELSTLSSELPDVIAEYQEKLFFTRLPLFALMLLIVGIALYYLVLVATMLVERQAGEIALLKSRGAGLGQIMTVYLVEGLALTVFAVVLGPLVASGRDPPARSNAALLRPEPGRAAERDPDGRSLRHGRARGHPRPSPPSSGPPTAPPARAWCTSSRASPGRPGQPLFLRYYLDLVLVGVGAFLFYQLRQRGSLVTENLFGDLSADPLLLVSPALFMLMMALIFPAPLPRDPGRRLVGAAGPERGHRAPRALAHGAKPAALQPAHSLAPPRDLRGHVRRRLPRNSRPQLRGPRRLRSGRPPDALSTSDPPRASPPSGWRTPSRPSTGSTRPAPPPAWRWPTCPRRAARSRPSSWAWAKSSPRSPSGGTTSAVTSIRCWPASSPGTTWTSPMAPSSRRVRAPSASGRASPCPTRPLAPASACATKTASSSSTSSSPTPWTRTMAGSSTSSTSPVPSPPRNTPPDLEGALEVESIFINIRRFAAAPGRVTAVLDDLIAYPEGGDRGDGVVIEPFESLERYQSITGASGAAETTITRADVGNDRGRYAAQVSFNYDNFSTSAVGLRLRRSPEPLRVLVSESFLEAIDGGPGDTIPVRVNRQVLQARITGSFELFPGFYPGPRDHLLVADLATLRGAGAGIPRIAGGINVNEVWLGSVEGVELTPRMAR